jgi:hypothetical protein
MPGTIAAGPVAAGLYRIRCPRLPARGQHRRPAHAATWSGTSLGHLELVPAQHRRRPPWRPRARAAASPAAVRSRIRTRSNSARDADVEDQLAAGVAVSITSWRLQNPMPRSARPVTVSTTCRGDLPSRSSFRTTRVSPGAADPAAAPSWRSARAALAVSRNTGSSRPLQGVDLELGLLVGGGDAGVSRADVPCGEPSGHRWQAGGGGVAAVAESATVGVSTGQRITDSSHRIVAALDAASAARRCNSR